uniref:Uncharacterized protein n=1 Tax=Nelumbo nucifera TaxID=4432 RepID=A0A823A0M0_NELNU|nr:TPA_asm: hypothetical protein HUJ06_017665 [Nelumbo nucifera]
MASEEQWTIMENGHGNDGSLKGSSEEIRHGRTAHNMSSSSLRKKSNLKLVSKLGAFQHLKLCSANIQEVILGTKLSVGKHPFLRLRSSGHGGASITTILIRFLSDFRRNLTILLKSYYSPTLRLTSFNISAPQLTDPLFQMPVEKSDDNSDPCLHSSLIRYPHLKHCLHRQSS